MRTWPGAISTLLLVTTAGCYGGLSMDLSEDTGSDTEPGAAETAGTGDTGDTGDDGPAEGLCGDPQPGASPIRRLSAFEYDNTIEDLLGDTSRPGENFAEEGGSGFDNNADVSTVSRLVAQKYMEAAETIAANAVSDLPGLLGCDPTSDESACVRSWIESFGAQAWRRPLTDDEIDGMLALHDQVRAELDTTDGVEAVLQAFLQSPFFLYRVELGTEAAGPDAVRLDDWEMASRLSYLLWGSMPDAALFEAAQAGELRSKAQIEQQARRMLDDPRARRMVLHFHQQWLDYGGLEIAAKDPEVFPEYGPEIAALQRQELDAFIDHVLWESQGTIEELLTAPYGFANAELAAFYGVEGVTGTDFVPLQDDSMARSGVLTLGGILSVQAKTNQTSPVARGLFVREQLLCQIPPPPPDDVDLTPPAPDPNATTRERYDQHRSDPACSTCHEMMDPIGFGLENYDGVGRWRADENGLPIDASGVVSAVSDIDDPAFDGPVELGAKLAASGQVRACVATQWFRYAYGRTESQQLDECTLEELQQRLDASGGSITELLVTLTQTDAFLFRAGGGE
jgi:hypothetical protein